MIDCPICRGRADPTASFDFSHNSEPARALVCGKHTVFDVVEYANATREARLKAAHDKLPTGWSRVDTFDKAIETVNEPAILWLVCEACIRKRAFEAKETELLDHEFSCLIASCMFMDNGPSDHKSCSHAWLVLENKRPSGACAECGSEAAKLFCTGGRAARTLVPLMARWSSFNAGDRVYLQSCVTFDSAGNGFIPSRDERRYRNELSLRGTPITGPVHFHKGAPGAITYFGLAATEVLTQNAKGCMCHIRCTEFFSEWFTHDKPPAEPSAWTFVLSDVL